MRRKGAKSKNLYPICLEQNRTYNRVLSEFRVCSGKGRRKEAKFFALSHSYIPKLCYNLLLSSYPRKLMGMNSIELKTSKHGPIYDERFKRKTGWGNRNPSDFECSQQLLAQLFAPLWRQDRKVFLSQATYCIQYRVKFQKRV